MDEIELKEDILRTTEAKFLNILEGLRRSVASSDAKLRVICNANNPALRISDDVLSYIMEEAWATSPSGHVEITLSHVCSRWRRASLSTPSLWTRIGAKGTSGWSKMEEYLNRAKGHLIDVEIELDETDPSEQDLDAIEHLLTRLASRSQRWRSLKISSHDQPFTPRNPHPIPFLKNIEAVANLKSLKLILDPPLASKHHFVPSRHASLFHNGAPNLTKLHFQTTNMDLLWFLPPLHNLTSLTIGSLAGRNLSEGFNPHPSIPIRHFLSLPKLRQFALLDDGYCSRLPCFDFGSGLTESAPAWSSRLRSLRVPLRFLPHFFSDLPWKVVEETTHLFVDIVYSPTSRPALLDLTQTHLQTQQTQPLLPHLTQLTLCFEYKGKVEGPLPRPILGLLGQLTPRIAHLVLLERSCELLDTTADWRMWPKLQTVYFDIAGYCERPSARQTNFVQELAFRLIELEKWRCERGFANFCVKAKAKSCFYLVESNVQSPLWRFFRHVAGPTLPAGDILWLPQICRD